MNKFIILTSISNALENAFNSPINPARQALTNRALYIISAVLLSALIVRGVFVWVDYRQGSGDFKWGALLVLFICLVVAVSAPSWMWGVIGW